MAHLPSAKPSFFRRRSLRLAAAAVMFLGLAATLRAVTVLDNTFDPGTPGLLIVTRDLTPAHWFATPFTTDGFAYELNSITADIQDFGQPPVGLFLEIWSVSSFNGGPLSSLGRLALVDANFPKVFETTILSGDITLSANTSYYVVAGVDNGGSSYREEVNLSNPPGPYFAVESGDWLLQTVLPGGSTLQRSFESGTSGSFWQEMGSLAAPSRMIIDATVVPEPSVWALLVFGGLVLGVRGLRSRA